jgi:hypothetical protein
LQGKGASNVLDNPLRHLPDSFDRNGGRDRRSGSSLARRCANLVPHFSPRLIAYPPSKLHRISPPAANRIAYALRGRGSGA